MFKLIRHSYHLVDESPWPIIAAFRALGLTTGFVKWFYFFQWNLCFFSLFILLLISSQWWRDVVRERSYQGLHTFSVEWGLRWGIILFIISEIFFFLSFFWAFFHRRLNPVVELGSQWPPVGILTFNSLEVPFLNTVVLVTSGMRITWSHHRIILNHHSQAQLALLITVILGIYFTWLQSLEYWEARFAIRDSVFGSSFFIATGFHGFHVIVGTTFLMICLNRLNQGHFNQQHHFGFEAAAWYWHFVDVVWLFLYLSIYWWGSF